MNSTTSIIIICAALALTEAAQASCGSNKNATPRDANVAATETATPMPSPSVTQTPAPQRPSGGEAMKVLAQGQYGKVEEAFLVVARESKVYGELRALVEGLPELGADFFQKHAVVAAFAGERSSGGYGVEIRRGADKRLSVEETTPPRDAMTTMALTQPFKVVAVEVGEEEPVEFDFSRGRNSTRWRPYAVTSGEFSTGGGFAGRYEKLTLGGSLRVARLGKLLTVLFSVKGDGGKKERTLHGAATGIEGDAAGLEIPHLDAGTLVDHPRPPLRAVGRFEGDAAKLSMTFESLPTNVSDGFGGTGKLEAKLSETAQPKNK